MNFFAGVREEGRTVVLALDVEAALQNELSVEFAEQAGELLGSDLEEVPYDPKRPIEKDSQVYVITPYTLPVEYRRAMSRPDEYEVLMPGHTLPPIKSLFAIDTSGNDGNAVHFQAFQATRLLQQNRITVLFRQSTLHRLKSAGLTFDSKLACTHINGRLYFKSFHLAHSCLNLADYLAEATDQEIRHMFDDTMLHATSPQKVAEQSDGWMRRRFVAIRASGILKKVTPREAQEKAKRFGLRIKAVRIDGELKVSFPESKSEMKEVLRFFNEGYYQGELTGTLFTTDSNAALKMKTE